MTTFLASLIVNLAVAVVLFFAFGGRRLLAHRDESGIAAVSAPGPVVPHVEIATPQTGAQIYGDAEAQAITEEIALETGQAPNALTAEHPTERATPENRTYQLLTIVGLILLAVLTLVYKLDIGFVALTIGLALSLMAPNLQKRAMGQVTWPEIMLITGVSTYVEVMQKMGTIDFVGNSVAGLASPLIAALLLCFIGAIVSAFASSTAVLGSLIPLAVPFLQSGTGVSPIGFVAAMGVSSTIVDVSPLSTNGALVLANARGIDRDKFFRQLLAYGALVTVVAPIIVWLALIVFV
jgi:di/tricarboxylate transporter